MFELFPLNSFQQIMLKWNAFAPYNAGHVMVLAGQPQLEQWERAILATIQEIKLGLPRLTKHHVSFIPIDRIKIEMVTIDLSHHVEKELNLAFSYHDFPMRFFVRQESDRYFIGVIYNHWLSDSYSMRAFFQRVYQRYQFNDTQLPPLNYAKISFRQLFKKYVGKPNWWYGLKEFVRCLLHFQSAYRLKLKDTMDFQTGFNLYYLPEGLIQTLAVYAKHHAVTLNDVFIAALTKTMSAYTHDEREKIKRKKFRLFARNRLAIGTIVDIRQPIQKDLENTFGQYLSNYTLVLKNADNTSFVDLLKRVNQQTSQIKHSFKTIKNFASWDISLFLWKFLKKPKTQAKFFSKHAPIVAGISNVNLTQSWVGESELLDYLRISPTGLLIPLVLTLTTVSDKLSLCVSYRTTAFSKDAVDQICKNFMDGLIAINSNAV